MYLTSGLSLFSFPLHCLLAYSATLFAGAAAVPIDNVRRRITLSPPPPLAFSPFSPPLLPLLFPLLSSLLFHSPTRYHAEEQQQQQHDDVITSCQIHHRHGRGQRVVQRNHQCMATLCNWSRLVLPSLPLLLLLLLFLLLFPFSIIVLSISFVSPLPLSVSSRE